MEEERENGQLLEELLELEEEKCRQALVYIDCLEEALMKIIGFKPVGSRGGFKVIEEKD